MMSGWTLPCCINAWACHEEVARLLSGRPCSYSHGTAKARGNSAQPITPKVKDGWFSFWVRLMLLPPGSSAAVSRRSLHFIVVVVVVRLGGPCTLVWAVLSLAWAPACHVADSRWKRIPSRASKDHKPNRFKPIDNYDHLLNQCRSRHTNHTTNYVVIDWFPINGCNQCETPPGKLYQVMRSNRYAAWTPGLK